jgi:hypothetical protein
MMRGCCLLCEATQEISLILIYAKNVKMTTVSVSLAARSQQLAASFSPILEKIPTGITEIINDRSLPSSFFNPCSLIY